MEKEAEWSELQLFTIFGRGRGLCVCVWFGWCQSFSESDITLMVLIGSSYNEVGLP
jgi:hypothetical protein